MLGTAHSQNGIQVTGVSLNLYDYTRIRVRRIQTSSPRRRGGRRQSESVSVRKRYAQPYVQQGRLGVERELFANTSLSVSYLYFRGVHLSRTRDINLGTPVRRP